MTKQKERPGNQTPNTPDFDESALSGMKVEELRAQARDLGVSGVADMRKRDLIDAVTKASHRRGGTGGDNGGGGVRTGPGSSKTIKYAQEIESPEDDPERPGRSLVTTSHDVIRQWAKRRKAKPATVPGTEHGENLGVLRFDFPGYGGQKLRHVDWEEWFSTFDSRCLNFIYQEERSDGSTSNFFRLENPNREDG